MVIFIKFKYKLLGPVLFSQNSLDSVCFYIVKRGKHFSCNFEVIAAVDEYLTVSRPSGKTLDM